MIHAAPFAVWITASLAAILTAGRIGRDRPQVPGPRPPQQTGV